jgi:hypothetical protein
VLLGHLLAARGSHQACASEHGSPLARVRAPACPPRIWRASARRGSGDAALRRGPRLFSLRSVGAFPADASANQSRAQLWNAGD